MTVLVTRAQEQAREFCTQLKQAGATVVELPVIAIAEPEDWSAFDSAIKNNKACPYDWIIFASQNAVEATLARLSALNCQDLFSGIKVASIGAATSKLLTSHGIRVDFEPSRFVAESLASELTAKYQLTGQKVLLPRADIGREVLGEGLIQAGADVDSVVVYRTILPNAGSDDNKVGAVVSLMQQGAIDFVTVASSQSVRNLATLLKNDLSSRGANSPAGELLQLMSKTRVIAIGPVTAQTALLELGQEAVVAAKHTSEGMLEAILTVLKFPKKAV